MRTVLLSALSILLVGCVDADASTDAVVRDSAGVAIVESAGPAWGNGEGWRVAAEPTVDIGVIEGDEAYQLHRVSDVDRLSDGTIVVAENTRLRLYDEGGRHLRDVGREGDAPGEFRWIASLQVLAGDTLLLHDPRARRVTLVRPDGSVVATVPVHTPRPLRAGSILGLLGGNLIGFASAPTEGDAEGFRRDTVLYVAYGRDGELADTLASALGRERIEQSTAVAASGGGVTFHTREMTIPFGRDVHHALGGRQLAVAQDDVWQIDVYGADGSLERSLRRSDVAPRAMSPDLVERYVGWMMDNAVVVGGAPEGQHEKQIREARYPESLPVFLRLRVDAEGSVWAEDFRFPSEEQPRWSVFDTEGQLLGSVETPPGLTVHAIGADWVLGTWRDELDVEHVRLHRLER